MLTASRYLQKRAIAATAVGSKCVVSFKATDHLKERCEQRGITLHQLQDAFLYGTKERSRAENMYMYTYKDISLIYNQTKNEGVTCFEQHSPMPEKKILVNCIRKVRMDRWTSHKVIVVDASARMGKADIVGARTRLALVWQIIADLIASQLACGSATSTDIVTIVVYGMEATILVKEWPCDWTLYNELVRIYNTDAVAARGHKKFLPALNLAKSLLTRQPDLPFARELYFMSDGIPSQVVLTEEKLIVKGMRRFAKKLNGNGNPFRFTAIGIGCVGDFGMLRCMVDEAHRCEAAASLIAARDRKKIGWRKRLSGVDKFDGEIYGW